MKKVNIKIIKDKSLRIKLIKKEFFYKIIKSLLQNNNIYFLKKNYLSYFLKQHVYGRIKSSRKKKTCLVTGSKHSIWNRFGICRQQVKRSIILNKLDNLKIYI